MTRSTVPPGIWALGFVSLLMDVSSEMILALLPVFLVSTLGTPMTAVGLIEGIAEATAAITKVFSGVLSDWFGRRKLLAVIGYGLAAATKPVFPLAPDIGCLVAARVVDRIGKGLRGAPRDALIGDLAPEEARGAAYGLRQALDLAGARRQPAGRRAVAGCRTIGDLPGRCPARHPWSRRAAGRGTRPSGTWPTPRRAPAAKAT